CGPSCNYAAATRCGTSCGYALPVFLTQSVEVLRECRPQFMVWTKHLFGCLEHVLGTACRVIDDSDQHGLSERDTEQPRRFSVGGRLFNSAQLLFAKARATQHIALSAAATCLVDQPALDEWARLRIAPSLHKIFGSQ